MRELPEGFGSVRCANPYGVEDVDAFLDELLEGARVVVARLLGGRRAWPEGVAALRARCARDGVALLLLGGEAEPDAELAELSSAPAATLAQAFEYLRHGGVENTANLLRFLADTLLREGHGFEPPRTLPDLGVYVPGRGDVALDEALAGHDPERPTVGARLLPLASRDRQHGLRRRAGGGARRGRRQRAVRVGLLAAAGRRRARAGARAARRAHRRARHHRARLGRLDGRRRRRRGPRRLEHVARRRAGGARRARDPGRVRDEQPRGVGGLPGRADAAGRRDAGRDPRVRRAHRRAAGELQGAAGGRVARGDAGPALRAPTSSAARGWPALAAGHARLRALDPADARVAIVLSSFPTKHARIGNAVGLDTPASAIALLDAPARRRLRRRARLRRRRRAHPRADRGRRPRPRLPHRRAARRRHRAPARGRVRGLVRRRCPQALRDGDERAVGPAAGRAVRRRRRLRARRAGSWATCSSPSSRRAASARTRWPSTTTPSSPPAHHYLAAYHWLRTGFGADAIVHLGKHGTLEWLPGKGLGPRARVRARRRAGRRAALLPLRRQRPRRGRAGQAPRARGDRRPPGAADDARRDLRRAGRARGAARRVRALRGARPAQAAGAGRAHLDAAARGRAAPRPRPRGGRAAVARGLRRAHRAHRRLPVRDQGHPDPGRAARARRAAGGRAVRRAAGGDPAPRRPRARARPAARGRRGVRPRRAGAGRGAGAAWSTRRRRCSRASRARRRAAATSSTAWRTRSGR